MTGPQADFWFPVSAPAASYTGQWYSENTMQGILAYRGQVTEAFPANQTVCCQSRRQQALGGYVNVSNETLFTFQARRPLSPTNHPHIASWGTRVDQPQMLKP